MPNKSLILLILIALLLRMIFTFIQPLSIDELLTYDVIRLNSLRDILIHITTHDLQMPSLYICLYFVKNFITDHHLIFRTLFSLFSLCTVYVSYLAGKTMGGVKVGLTAAFLYSMSFSIILYSVEFRPYSPLLLISTTMCWVYIRKDKNFFIFLLALSILGSSFHYYGSLLILPYLFLEKKYLIDTYKKYPLSCTSAFILGIVSLLLLMPIVLKNYNMSHSYREGVQYFGFFELLNFLSLAFWGPVGFVFTFLMLVLFIYKSNDRRLNRKIACLIFIGLIPITIVLIKSLTSTPTLEPRYLIIFIPSFLIAASVIFSKLKLKIIVFFIVLFDLLFYRNILVAFRQDKSLVYAASRSISRDLGLPLLSCGLCFWPYAQDGDHYHCFKSGDFGNMPPKSAILIVSAVDNSFCADIFGQNIIDKQPIRSSGSYKIYQYNNMQ